MLITVKIKTIQTEERMGKKPSKLIERDKKGRTKSPQMKGDSIQHDCTLHMSKERYLIVAREQTINHRNPFVFAFTLVYTIEKRKKTKITPK